MAFHDSCCITHLSGGPPASEIPAFFSPQALLPHRAIFSRTSKATFYVSIITHSTRTISLSKMSIFHASCPKEFGGAHSKGSLITIAAIEELPRPRPIDTTQSPSSVYYLVSDPMLPCKVM